MNIHPKKQVKIRVKVFFGRKFRAGFFGPSKEFIVLEKDDSNIKGIQDSCFSFWSLVLMYSPHLGQYKSLESINLNLVNKSNYINFLFK